MTNNPRFILVVTGWTNDLSGLVPLTIYEQTDEEVQLRLLRKSSDDAFTSDHLTDRATYERLSHEQAGLCLQCNGALDGESQLLEMDNGYGLYCSDCSPLRLFARSTAAARLATNGASEA